MSTESIAINRFGLGVRPDEKIQSPRRWLVTQLDRFEVSPAPWRSVQHTPALVKNWAEMQSAVRQAPEGQQSGIREAYLRKGRDTYLSAAAARTNSALQSSTPFVERMVHFWSNHFAVSVDKLLIIGLAGSFEADAIRPHVLGRFEDLLLAAVRHPAMMLYLDQARSTGPNSMIARRAGSRQQGQQSSGLNENLAREILELHTLGVRSGYTQDDVTEFARALTGWTLPGAEALDGTTDGFRFVQALHEPGSRTVLGRTYPEGSEAQARAILRDLAIKPATARHIATKLARHFVADEPPPALVQRLANNFIRTGGDLHSLYQELIESSEVWQTREGKFKSPWDWTISSMRALSMRDIPATQITNLMNQLGQPIWRPGAPTGFGDMATTWAAPDALLRRVEAAQRLATQAGDAVDARVLAPVVLPDALSLTTAKAIASSESPRTAIALLLASPEFLRR